MQRNSTPKITEQKFFFALIATNFLILLVLPQLNNVHYDPLPQFFAEVTCAWADISLFLIVCLFSKQIYVPRISIMLILLGIFFSLQVYFVPINYPGLSYVASGEMLIVLLGVVSVSTLIQEFGLPRIVNLIAWCLLIGAILQSIIGMLQFSGLYKIFGTLIFYDSAHPQSDIFGHFGQRNHYCHYLSWAVFGLIYLYHQRKVNLAVFLPLVLWLLFSMSIASSRSVFIYFALAILISGSYAFFASASSTTSAIKQQHKPMLKLFYLIVIVSILLIFCEYAYPFIAKLCLLHNSSSSGLERITANSSNLIGRRLIEWQKAFLVFTQMPVFGCGLNEYAKYSVYLQPLFKHVPANDGLFTNCHNLILQFLAETGLIGTLILVVGTIYALSKIMRQKNIETVIILCMLFTTIAHSMLEYPLWYLYFLVPCGLFLAIEDKPLCVISSEIIAGIAIIPVSILVYLMLNAAFMCNTLTSYIDVPSDTKQFKVQAKYLANLAQHSVLWSYPAMYTLDDYITVDNANTNQTFSLAEQLTLENQFSNFHPYPDNLIKQAMLNWDVGNDALAYKLVNLALVAYPIYKDEYKHLLKAPKYKPLTTLIYSASLRGERRNLLLRTINYYALTGFVMTDGTDISCDNKSEFNHMAYNSEFLNC